MELENCKDECEKITECSSVDLDTARGTAGCWMHGFPYDATDVSEDDKCSHYVIDRSSKTVERCIGEYEGELHFTFTRITF